MIRKRFSTTEDAALIRMHDAEAMGFSAIGRALNRTPSTCATRYTLLANRRNAPRRVARPCMTCRAPFQSEGAHNRMCDPCRQAGSGCPFEPDDYPGPLQQAPSHIAALADRDIS